MIFVFYSVAVLVSTIEDETTKTRVKGQLAEQARVIA